MTAAGGEGAGRVDLHAHILPELDHGPASWEEALEMARAAVADGTTLMAATPHVSQRFGNTRERILGAVEEFRGRLAGAGIPLEVAAGADYHLTPELVAGADGIVTLGGGNYFLLEFDSMIVPPGVMGIVDGFLARGLVPVITHPERNHYLRRRPELLSAMASRGCVHQLTAGSFTGVFGEEVRRSALDLLGRGLCGVVASDAHWVGERPPILSAALAAVASVAGEGRATELFGRVPREIVRGRPRA